MITTNLRALVIGTALALTLAAPAQAAKLRVSVAPAREPRRLAVHHVHVGPQHAPASARHDHGEAALDGYWLVGADGGVFAFGNAPFHGTP